MHVCWYTSVVSWWVNPWTLVPHDAISTDPSQGLTKLPGIKRSWVPGLVNYQFAMENGPFIDGLPIKNDDFP